MKACGGGLWFFERYNRCPWRTLSGHRFEPHRNYVNVLRATARVDRGSRENHHIKALYFNMRLLLYPKTPPPKKE